MQYAQAPSLTDVRAACACVNAPHAHRRACTLRWHCRLRWPVATAPHAHSNSPPKLFELHHE